MSPLDPRCTHVRTLTLIPPWTITITRPPKAGHVHHGFCTYWADLVALGMADTLLELTRTHPDYTLFVTGHSLGGAAVSSLFLGDILQTDRDTYAHAQPLN